MNYAKKLYECVKETNSKHNDAVYTINKEHEQAVVMAVIDRAIDKRLNGGSYVCN